MLDTLLNNATQSGASQKAGGGFSLDQLLTGPGGLATGAAAGGLAAILMGGAKPKKLAKNALKVGGVALVGGLAYKAYRDWQSNRDTAAQNHGLTNPTHNYGRADETAFLPASSAAQTSLARSLARAMIVAAKADGHVNDDERQKIMAQLSAMDINQQDRAFIAAELDGPANIDAVVADATTPEIAADLFAASLLAVDPDGAAESAYLSLLAARLKLDPDLAVEIKKNVSQM